MFIEHAMRVPTDQSHGDGQCICADHLSMTEGDHGSKQWGETKTEHLIDHYLYIFMEAVLSERTSACEVSRVSTQRTLVRCPMNSRILIFGQEDVQSLQSR